MNQSQGLKFRRWQKELALDTRRGSGFHGQLPARRLGTTAPGVLPGRLEREAMSYVAYLHERAQACRDLARSSTPEEAKPLADLAREYDRWAELFEKRGPERGRGYHRHH